MSFSIIGLVSGSPIPNAIQTVGSRETWQDGLLNLPQEILLHVVAFLTPAALVKFAQVSVRPYQITRDERLYQVISNTEATTYMHEILDLLTARSDRIRTIFFRDLFPDVNNLFSDRPAIEIFANRTFPMGPHAIKCGVWEIRRYLPNDLQNAAPDWAEDQIRAKPFCAEFRQSIENILISYHKPLTIYEQANVISNQFRVLLRSLNLDFFNTLRPEHQKAIKYKMWENEAALKRDPNFTQDPDWAGNQIRNNLHSPQFCAAIENEITSTFFNSLRPEYQEAVKHKMWEDEAASKRNRSFTQDPDWAGNEIRKSLHYRPSLLRAIQDVLASLDQNSQTILQLLREGSLAVQEQPIFSQDLP